MDGTRVTCEWLHDAFTIVAPVRPWRGGRIIIIAGGLAAVGLCALGALALQSGASRDYGEAVVFFAGGAFAAYAAALITFEKTIATVDRSAVTVRRAPLPVWPVVRHRGELTGIALPEILMYARSGSAYTVFPIVAAFGDGYHVTFVENAGNATAAEAIGGKVAGGLGVSLVHGPLGSPAHAQRRAKLVLVVTACIVAVVVAAFATGAVLAPHEFGF